MNCDFKIFSKHLQITASSLVWFSDWALNTLFEIRVNFFLAQGVVPMLLLIKELKQPVQPKKHQALMVIF